VAGGLQQTEQGVRVRQSKEVRGIERRAEIELRDLPPTNPEHQSFLNGFAVAGDFQEV